MNLKKGYVSLYKPKLDIPKRSWLVDNQFAIMTVIVSLFCAGIVYLVILVGLYLVR